jgi:hypothetical protein
LASKKILTEISEFMDVLQGVGKDCLIKEGHLTLSVGYDSSDPYMVKEKLEEVLASIMQHIPSPFGLPPMHDWIDLDRIVIEKQGSRIDIEFEVPPVIFPNP